MSVELSILDLVFINQGETPRDAIQNSVQVAKAAESLDYKRIWIAEHHNFPSIASAATSVVIGHIASHTNTIRVGAGGIMLPNHSPLVIAEQFGTLESLYPNRIDLGLGRAPGTDQLTLRALRRDAMASQHFPEDVKELIEYLSSEKEEGKVNAIPGFGTNVPVWILGSSLFGAQLAALLGLPFAFASHFAPTYLKDAVSIYKKQFRPSAHLEKPYVMMAMNVIAADSDPEAEYLFSSVQQSFLGILRNKRTPFPPPVASMDLLWSETEKQMANQMLSISAVGDAKTIKSKINQILSDIVVDELMVVSSIFDTSKRIRSLEILMGIKDQILVSST
ncbi:LLM class flavin-dependent oxidoreductase [Leptospira biflexa]|uniref:Luciferase-like monooxygenase n=1 Tax=Leptospira biflexa serovar Patoc (strain Patoc 1 / ATCC 23582 / Paris) TaxID=456481 RepID=B0SLJ0_LEPBP|nr:LLM class flavin-dependent oxidoreductase [Leptospira biflexa]ABZ94904.1 Flavin-dependent oxidoreductase [Leptospira biflexa serovar Patoc strain 'Patoc 1 (Ames)']ABZ98576.1 Putative enzyme [Leptospira biflexa serovar Patoc strain 'Patoc 1 (Paris)']TGM33652.1 LLM class flavin-dependent oxidoreductase [Leptospira biflexa]TGM34478.1 LLM class flavin-dependent oxidoreductase [Leptospira biflexa]TGM43956.1 LLM class flavin-dependent oxidoreductase [Leptospira biflexa]